MLRAIQATITNIFLGSPTCVWKLTPLQRFAKKILSVETYLRRSNSHKFEVLKLGQQERILVFLILDDLMDEEFQ